MAHVNFAPDVMSISGKLCSKSGTVYSVNQQTGITYRSDRHGYHDANTEVQQAIRKDFTSKAKMAAAWWKANKPATKDAKGSENYQLVLKAYKQQHKIGNPYAYMRTLIGDDLKVRLGDLDITGDVSVVPGGNASGGGSSSGSGGSQGGESEG